MKEAALYSQEPGDKITCLTCAHNCIISPGKRGVCRVRENRDSKLYSLVYGKPVATHCDPVEKKPLFHFLPGTRAFSIATAGCNMHCLNCQNADISQAGPEITGNMADVPPEKAVDAALVQDCSSIAYTYTEPAVFLDYMHDIAVPAREAGLKNIAITNGFWSNEALEYMAPLLDAVNIDLKFFSDDLYKKVCGARLEPVLHTIQQMKDMGVWVEVTTLVIPGLNDAESHLADIAAFIASVDTGIPWHISRFFPYYRMKDRSPTPVETLTMARQAGIHAGLKFVYTGNIPGDEGEHTFCPECREKIVSRYGFSILNNDIDAGHCARCGAPVPGVWAD